MTKWKRELTQLAEGEGICNIRIVDTRNNHLRIEGEYRGKGIKILTSLSPSCHRTTLNCRSVIRQNKRAIDSIV